MRFDLLIVLKWPSMLIIYVSTKPPVIAVSNMELSLADWWKKAFRDPDSDRWRSIVRAEIQKRLGETDPDYGK